MADRTKKISEFPSLLDPNGNTRILASHTSNSGATNTYNLSIQKLSDTIFQLEVPTATTTIKGIVKVGNNLSINSSGHLSATLGNYVTFAHLNANFPNFDFVNTTFVTINSLSSYVTVNTLSNYATVTILNNAIANLAMNALPTTANNTYYVGDIPASEVVSSTQLQDNLANYMLLSDMYTHVTTTTLADNVATLTANNTFYVGSVTAANVVSNAQLQDNLANYATTSSLSSYVTSTDLSNNLSNYSTTSDLSNNLANYATTTSLGSYVTTTDLSNNLSNYATSTSLGSYVSSTDLSNNLTNYATTSSLSSYVTTTDLSNNLSNYSTTTDLSNNLSNYATTSSLSSYQTTADLSANISSYLADGNDKTITANTITLNANVIVNGNTNYFVGNNIVYADPLIELHAPGANVANTWTFDDGKDIGFRFHYYDSADKNAALVLSDDKKYLEFYIDGTETSGTFSGTYGDIKGRTFYSTTSLVVGDNVTNATINSTAFSGTANNSNYLGGFAKANYETWITSNASAAYTNAVSYVDGKSYANTLQVTSNASAAYTNAVSYVDGKSFANTLQVTSNASAAYTNAVAYVDGKSYVNSVNLTNNLSNYALTSSLSSYQTTAGLASNVQTLTANNANNLGGVAAASYVQNTDSRILSGNLTFSSYLTAGIGATSVLKLGSAEEIFTTYSSVNGSFTFNCTNGNIFYASSVAANFTPVITNYTIDTGTAVGITIVLNQGATPYAPTSNLTFGAGGSNVTVNWQGTTAPSGTANKLDVVTYSILNNSGTYTVLGQLTSFG